MLDDRILPLAFSMYKNPGVYALLLGSGVSRSAGIPTGWEVVNDLIKQIAAALDEEVSAEPEIWFEETFGKEPRYDALLQRLGKSPLDRNAILRDYFEPTDDERKDGIKVPTPAHHAIAWLIKQGYIRVVLTTNFDRLLETALAEIGVTPNVVSTQAQLLGMKPLQHSDISIIKLHGDYLDGDFKNTADELAEYTDEMNALLDRIFDEHGLIVCGWSGEWDTALRQAIERTVQRRYSTFWVAYRHPEGMAQKLINHRGAEVIDNTSADDFFQGLQRMIQALEGANRREPLSVAVAIQLTKKLIPNPGAQIELEELLRAEVERAFEAFMSEDFIKRRKEIIDSGGNAQERFEAIWELYYEAIEIPLNMAAVIAWYGDENHSRYFVEAVARWLELPAEWDWGGTEKLGMWRLLPALSLIYVVGIASVGNAKWIHLPPLLRQHAVSPWHSNQEVGLLEVIGEMVEEFIGTQKLNRFASLLCKMLRRVFQELIPSDRKYEYTFDAFDMLLGLLYLDQSSETRKNWTLSFSLVYENRSWEILKGFWVQGGKQGKDWQLLQTGLFDGKTDRVLNALQHFASFVNEVRKERLRHWDPLPDYAQLYEEALHPSGS